MEVWRGDYFNASCLIFRHHIRVKNWQIVYVDNYLSIFFKLLQANKQTGTKAALCLSIHYVYQLIGFKNFNGRATMWCPPRYP